MDDKHNKIETILNISALCNVIKDNMFRHAAHRFMPVLRRFSSNSNQAPKRKVIEIITQEDKMTLVQHALRRPFKSYFKVGSATFGLCFLTNLSTSFLHSGRREFMTTNPDIFTMTLLSKCFQFGLIWPSFYIKALTRPREVFLLGGGVEAVVDETGNRKNVKKAWEFFKNS